MESKAPVAVMQEVYVNGVSTRKVGHLVQQLGLAGDAKEHRLACARARMTQVPAFKAPPGGPPPLPLARCQGGARRSARRGALQKRGDRLGRPGVRPPGGDRPRCRRSRGRGPLARVPELGAGPWPWGVRLRVSDASDLKVRHRRGARPPLGARHRARSARHARPLAAPSSRCAREAGRGRCPPGDHGPTIASLLTEAEDDLLACYALPKERWSCLSRRRRPSGQGPRRARHSHSPLPRTAVAQLNF